MFKKVKIKYYFENKPVSNGFEYKINFLILIKVADLIVYFFGLERKGSEREISQIVEINI